MRSCADGVPLVRREGPCQGKETCWDRGTLTALKLAVVVTMETPWKSLACVVIVVAMVASKVVPERDARQEFMTSQGKPARCPQLTDHSD